MQSIQNFKTLSGKIFIGYIQDIPDPTNTGRHAVYIPNILKSQIPGEKYIFCKEIINTYVRTRDPLKNGTPYFSYGSYQPLIPGTKVLVTFVNNSMDSGYIIGIDGKVKQPFAKEWLIFKTKNDTEMYVDDDAGIIHINNKFSNVYMTQDEIILQVNKQKPNDGEDEKEAQTYIQLDKSSIMFKVGNSSYSFNENGIILHSGEKAATYLEISKDTININATKSVNISSDEGSVAINSQYTYLTGYNELHLFGNDARFTGAQKAQISGTTVVMWGWFDAHVKGLHVGIDAWLSYDTFTTLKNEVNLALSQTTSIIDTKTTSLESSVTGVKAESYSIKAQDGIVISNMGIGAAVSGSMNASMSAISLSTKLILMTINTGLLMSDPFTGAANQVLTMTIGGAANQALGSINTFGNGMSYLDKNNAVIGVMKLRETHEETSKKYILPDQLSI